MKDRHLQPKQTIKNKIRVPRVNYLLLHHHELTTTLNQTKTYHTKAVKEPTPVPETTVFTWTHVHTATSAKQQLLSTHPYYMILYSTHQNHSCKTMVEPAAAASICATLSLHRSAAAFFASTASWRALMSGMKSLLRRRNISHSTLPGAVVLRR